MNYFNYYNSLWSKEQPIASLPTDQNHTGILRMVSMHPDGLQLANEINKWSNLPQDVIGTVLYHTLPKRSPGSVSLPKKNTKKLTKVQERYLKKIQARYNCSDLHGEQILRIFKNNKIKLGT